VLEDQGLFAAGDHADRGGAADVQRVLTAQGGQLGGAGGDGVFEVEGVGQVELAVDPRGAGEGDLVVVDGEVPALGCLGAAFGGVLGHEPGYRLLDGPLGLGHPDPVRERRHHLVHIGRGLHREGMRPGLLGDPPRPPRRQRPGPHPSPDLRQPVGQLQRVGDQDPPGPGREAQCGGELGDRELTDQRCTRTGDRDPGVLPPPRPPGRRILDLGDLVQLSPLDRHLEHTGLGGIGVSTELACSSQHRGCFDVDGA
jgi:hypothetical protein